MTSHSGEQGEAAEGKRSALIRTALLIAEKDLRTEFRRFYELFSLVSFVVGSMLIAGLALETVETPLPAVVIWITLFFVAILVFTTSFIREADRGTLGGLKSLPSPPLGILAGKILYGTILLVGVSLVLVISAFFFLHLDPMGGWGGFLLIVILGAVCLALAGSFVSGLVMFSGEKTMLLSFLLLPLCVPVLVPAVMATVKVIEGAGVGRIIPELQLLLAFLLLVSGILILTFHYLLEE